MEARTFETEAQELRIFVMGLDLPQEVKAEFIRRATNFAVACVRQLAADYRETFAAAIDKLVRDQWRAF
jgi:hypothetical protein